MNRLVTSLYLFLASCAAFAQSTKPEPPTEHASPLTVMIFLGLFFGSIGAYFVYLWWTRKGRKDGPGE